MMLYHVFVSAPANFPAPYRITVTEGESVADISRQLADHHVIRSTKVFDITMRLLGGDRSLSQGEYVFDQPLSTFSIAMRFAGKDFGISRTKVTFPEGYTNEQMAVHLQEIFPTFDTAQFLTLANGQQGYLFPDTYSFFPTPTPAMVIAAMQQNYQNKLAPLEESIAQTGHSESDIITMASIIEKEAHGDNDRAMIAGILWNRIAKGIPLEVDAATVTYTEKGLPAAPIDNPGLAAIMAAIHPATTSYLYYLHDASGNIHYASTYQQHEQNIKEYLK